MPAKRYKQQVYRITVEIRPEIVEDLLAIAPSEELARACVKDPRSIRRVTHEGSVAFVVSLDAAEGV